MRTDASQLRLAVFTDTFAPQVNGVARTLERLVNAVSERGGVVRVFTVDDPTHLETGASSEQTTASMLYRYPSVPFWAYDQLRLAWPSRRQVRRDVAAFAPTLVHAATEFGVGLVGRQLAREFGVPFVSSYHTSFAAYAQYYRLGALKKPGWSFLRWFHNGGLRTYCPTQSIVDEVKAAGFVNTKVWSRGVDTMRFSPRYRSPSLREQIGATDDTLVVAYVGRLAAEKGLMLGIDAVNRAGAARPGRIKFVAVGDGPLSDDVHKCAPAGSWLPGRLDGESLSTAYASADVFLFPSITDTFGNVLLEAMASGLPVLAANAGPTREQVWPNRGWLVDTEDSIAMAEALIEIVDNPERRRAARAEALRFASEKSWDQVWNELIADYLTLHRC